MDIAALHRLSEFSWQIPPGGNMRVPAVLFGSEQLMRELDPDAARQISNVACLPGIVTAAMAMPDAHRGYGFPIGGVAAFDEKLGGVVSAGGVGFDISCGVRTLRTGLTQEDILSRQEAIADALYEAIPCGVGRGGAYRLGPAEMDDMLSGGAEWAVSRGMGTPEDLMFCEERGRMAGAEPRNVSDEAKSRFIDQLGTLGSGNHYLELQCVEEIFDPTRAAAFGIAEGDVLVSIHCGSRGLGHQIGTDYLAEMKPATRKTSRKNSLKTQGKRSGKGKKGAPAAGSPGDMQLPDRELACAPLASELGRRYLGAMAAGVNCALANRQTLSHLTRQALAKIFPSAELTLLYDVSHNTCKVETHEVAGKPTRLHVHRKGATRALPPGHGDLPQAYLNVGQPVMVGGSMGTSSYILAGCDRTMSLSFGSACHGAGRKLGRMQARRMYKGADVLASLAHRGILIRTGAIKGVAEEAPEAYKNIEQVVLDTASAGLADRVARLKPLVCIKG